MTKEEATKKIKKVIEESTIFDDEVEAFDMAIKALEEQRPKGKWESHIDYDRFDGYSEDCEPIYRDMKVYCCPFCGDKIYDWAKNYCAECGAEMEAEE